MDRDRQLGSSKLTLTGGAKLDLWPGNNDAGKISVPTLDLNNATQTFSSPTKTRFTVTSVIQNGALTYKAGSRFSFALRREHLRRLRR